MLVEGDFTELQKGFNIKGVSRESGLWPLPFYNYVTEDGKTQQKGLVLLSQIKQDKLQEE